MKITVKTQLLSAAPPFVGTRLGIEIDEPIDGKYLYGLYSAQLADGCDSVTVDWGDGKTETVAELSRLVHEYDAPGRYEVKVSDEVKTLVLSALSDQEGYPALKIIRQLTSIVCNATKLTSFGRNFCNAATSLHTLDLSQSPVSILGALAFSGCTALPSEVRLRPVTTLPANAFKGCSQIGVLHFATSSEAVITSSTGYKSDPTFGTGTAILKFDL